jgi:hypothetical protein
MKSVKTILTLVVLLLLNSGIYAQVFEVPKNVKMKKAKDYEKYEADIIKAVNWLESTPLDKYKNKRKDVNKFLIQWLSGAPNVTIELSTFQLDYTDKNPELLIIFMGAWAKDALENPDSEDKALAGNLAGFKSILKFYKANIDKGLKKNKKIEKLLKLSDSELEAWVKEQING